MGEQDRDWILVVEDDDSVREALLLVLHAGGYDAVGVHGGDAALTLLRVTPTPPRVILLDIMMAEGSGPAFRAAQRADPRLAGIPLVAVSAHPDAQRLVAPDAILAKPFDVSQLFAVVERYAGRRSLG
jgi:CheY-like chemotaxis protein